MQSERDSDEENIEPSDEEGSENAPEDSGFISEDNEERIVNESSLYHEESCMESSNQQ